MQNCLLTVTRNTAKFRIRGRSQELVAQNSYRRGSQILRQKKSTSTTPPELVFSEER